MGHPVLWLGVAAVILDEDDGVEDDVGVLLLPLVEGDQVLKHLAEPVLPLCLEPLVDDVQILLEVGGLGLQVHGDIGGVQPELIGCDGDNLPLPMITDS